ncbi:hypothetical protein KO527_16240 [Pseudoalteromonas sp. C2R02]|uniref:hypothetical protein n=1 Tax=Pseudoalteromonas sp. C2R02 TaxID=2841565 RepID=UPI001C08B044|nr:hypothetical protein [Pseudoalteromonas sp. C2R02]MBU2970902.1 hypothetical protein [Pseudoalteromonas sp. C2R02]
MRHIFWLFLIAISVDAKEPIKLVSDLEAFYNNTKIDIASIILNEIETHKFSKINFTRIEADRIAQWRLLKSRSHICLYNKMKRKPRLEYSIFTDLPLTAYPSNRLITYKNQFIKGDISLYEMVNLHGLKIGIIESRSYGNKLDKQISNLKSKLIVISGEDSAQRLRKMFLQKKIDAIIEYESVFSYENRKTITLTDFNFHRINNTDNFAFGYISCSKSDQGEKAITNFNKILNDKVFETQILNLHKLLFVGKEQILAIAALEKIFRNNAN